MYKAFESNPEELQHLKTECRGKISNKKWPEIQGRSQRNEMLSNALMGFKKKQVVNYVN